MATNIAIACMQVMRHELGAPAREDQVVLEEPSEAHFVGLGRTKDWAYATVNINSKTDSEVRRCNSAAAVLLFYCCGLNNLDLRRCFVCMCAPIVLQMQCACVNFMQLGISCWYLFSGSSAVCAHAWLVQ
jgi:hypothetical protein